MVTRNIKIKLIFIVFLQCQGRVICNNSIRRSCVFFVSGNGQILPCAFLQQLNTQVAKGARHVYRLARGDDGSKWQDSPASSIVRSAATTTYDMYPVGRIAVRPGVCRDEFNVQLFPTTITIDTN